MATLQFEDVLRQVGEFGRYQKTLVCVFLIPAVTVIPWFTLNVVFLSSTPDHWCYVPELETSDLSVEDKMLLLRPTSDPSCSMYDVNFTELLSSGNWTVRDEWPTRPCAYGWQYDKTVFDATASTRWNLVCDDSYYSSMIVSLVFVGNVLGCPTFGCLPDRIGRKATFLLMAALTGLTEIVSVFMPDFTAFLVLRTINGTTGTTIYIVSYIILLELVGPDLRTRMNGFAITAWTLGLCLLPLVSWLTRSWIGLSVSSSFAAFCLLLNWKVIPESPRWLLSQGRYEEACIIMCNVSRVNGQKVHESPVELMEQLKRVGEEMKKEKENSVKYSYLDFLRYPQLRKKFLILTFCWISNCLGYYGLQVNVKNLFGNQFINFFLLAIVELPGHALAWFIMQKVGRRWCSVGFLALTSFACLVPVLLMSEYSSIGVVSSLFGKLGASAAYMSLYQQAPELYPTPLRGLGMSLSASIGTAVALTSPYISDLSAYGDHLPFLIISIVSICASVTATLLPETLDRELPQTIADSENLSLQDMICSCFRRRRRNHSGKNLITGFTNLAFGKDCVLPTVGVSDNDLAKAAKPSIIITSPSGRQMPESSNSGHKVGPNSGPFP